MADHSSVSVLTEEEKIMDRKQQNIQISVDTEYVRHHSDPKQEAYRFAYTITIENRGTVGAKLIQRHWLIRDDQGTGEEVHGEGVVGQQPFLAPGESFQYTSSAQLKTPHGIMEGHYEWLDEAHNLFLSPIEPFYLSVPRVLH